MISSLLLRNLPAVALVAVLAGAVWWITDAFRDRAQLRFELAATVRKLDAAEAELQRAAEVANIHRAHLSRAANEARVWDALSNDLQQMEGRDAPLSPLLSATVGRLFRAGQ